MAQATTKKLVKAQAVTVDTLEAMRYDTTPVKGPKMPKGYKYDNPVIVSIRFELSDREKSYKICNREDKGFTDVVNDGLQLLLYSRGLIKEEEIKSEEIRNLIKAIYKPQKYTRKTK